MHARAQGALSSGLPLARVCRVSFQTNAMTISRTKCWRDLRTSDDINISQYGPNNQATQVQ